MGTHWNVGAVAGNNISTAYALTPSAEWKGKTYTQAELYKLWDAGQIERGDDTGLRVKFRGKDFVLTDRKHFISTKEGGPNAIQEPSTAPLPVGQTPGDRPQVGARVPEPEKPPGAQAPPKDVPPKETPTLTGDAERDARLKNLRALRGPKTAGQEKSLAILEAQAKADPSKWAIGDGVGWRVDRQINRGYRVEQVDAAKKLALVRPVADTGLTVTGGGMEGIGAEWVHVADLVRDKKYDAPKPGQPAVAKVEKEVQKVAATSGQAPAKAVKAEYVKRVEDEIEKLVSKQGWTATQNKEHPQRWELKAKDGNSVAVDIEQNDKGFTGTVFGVPGGKVTITGKTIEDVLYDAKAHGSSEGGKVTINIPGDGDVTVFKNGQSLVELRNKARRIAISSTEEAVGVQILMSQQFGPRCVRRASCKNPTSLEPLSRF
jgi:hypothetical protein